MKVLVFFSLFVFLFLFVVGCAKVSEALPTQDTGFVRITKLIAATGCYRFIDQEAGVACWTCGNGISCLPMSYTELP